MAAIQIDVVSFLFLLGITVIIGYIGILIFHRTKIPDVIWLLLFGILVGPVIGLIDRTLFLSFAQVFSSIAILIILFDAGLNLDFYDVIRNAPKSLLLGILNIGTSMVLIGYFAVLFMGFGFLEGLLLGAIVGGTSSAVVIGIVEGISMRDSIKDLLKLESIFTDPLTIVIAIFLINLIITSPAVSGYPVIRDIIASFSIGIVLGLLSGLVWLYVLDRLKGKPFDYMLTLATLFILYGFSEVVGGSGPVASLAFGLVLGNSRKFSIMLRFRKMFTLDREMKAFHSEISFFIKSFFFVFLGIIVLIDPQVLVMGIIIAAMLMIARIFAVLAITGTFRKGTYLTPMERGIMLSMAPRGLAAAILAQLPLLFGFPNAEIFSGIAFTVIIATVIYTTIAATFFSRKMGEEEKARLEKEKLHQDSKKKTK